MKSDDTMIFMTERNYTRADGFLKRLGFSNTLMKRSFLNGCVRREGEVLFRNTPLGRGDTVRVRFLDEASDLAPAPLHQMVVYEDRDLLILNKGIIATMPCAMYPDRTLANEVYGHFQAIGLERKVRMLGRLDRETTGLVAVCKNPYAHQKLLKDHTQSKRYLALVWGHLKGDGVIDQPIGPGEWSLVRIFRDDGQRAVTHYRSLEAGEKSLIELALETGRTHQIRAHLAGMGHPIVGDTLYGGGSGRVALHVHRLCLIHPRTGRKLVFHVRPPWKGTRDIEK